MAIGSTVYKAALQVSDMDRNRYGDYSLTLARHPSETEERMMVRLLAFALNATEALAFGRGLSADDEPDLWEKDLTGNICLWIDVGLPDEKLVRKACSRSERTIVYAYGGRAVQIWWDQAKSGLAKLSNLSVFNLPAEFTRSLSEMAERSMQLQCLIQEGSIWFSNQEGSLSLEIGVLKP
jgi:uncharacterized protein YaeQ